MGSESPSTNRETFEFIDRATPPPTTSSYMPRYDHPGKGDDRHRDTDGLTLPRSNREAEGDDNNQEKDDDDGAKGGKGGPLGPGANPGYDKEQDAIKKVEGKKNDDDKNYDGKKMNGTDALDGKWVNPPLNMREEEDDDKCVKCLYYTMQCCECTIV